MGLLKAKGLFFWPEFMVMTFSPLPESSRN